ncbi:MAG: AAA family ATPase [Halanaerobiales bacterium]|nr:AAA family ATPase [Halanaerobiales bacterium]
MKIPYGITDFEKIREENLLYIDKTKYIEVLEDLNTDYLFFIRPRRFGKSLFLSVLEHYYDLERKEEFDKLFADLYIGKKSTKRKNSYFVLKFNFSGLNTTTYNELLESFEDSIVGSLIRFFTYYNMYFLNTAKIILKIEKARSIRKMLDILYNEVATTNYKIYLIIDEYDHFANDIIAMGDGDYYRELIRASGFVRDFYENIKIGTEKVIDKIFITGIAPIMLDDMTSGFNISSNITMIPQTNEMLGFTEAEVKNIFAKLSWVNDQDDIMTELRKYYNGYLFNNSGKSRVYNPDMILYFLGQWQLIGEYPDQLIDDNVKTDYGRLNRLIANQKNREIVEQIIETERITAKIVTKFSFEMMYDDDYFVSLLFYMGLLTIEKKVRKRYELKIPNYAIKMVYWEYFEKKLGETYHLTYNRTALEESIEEMAYAGDIKPFLEFTSEQILQKLSNRDLMRFNEKNLKIILRSLLAVAEVYNPISEREVENGYIDIYLEKDFRFQDIKYEWLWELKYLKKVKLVC